MNDNDEARVSYLPEILKVFLAQRIMETPPGMGTVYYIGCPETYRVKIGFTSKNPWSRLATLKTGAPTRIGLLAMHPGTIEDERRMHDLFSENRAHGEWFNVDDLIFEMLAYICWATAVGARAEGREPPKWAKGALNTLEAEFGPLPTDLGGMIQ